MSSSDSVLIEMAHPPVTNNVPELYSDPLCSSSSSSSDSNRATHAKDSNVKLPYPVLADHRDPSSVLILLQNETQTTSKKILDVTRQIELGEQRLTSERLTENEKKTLKYQRVKSKQQLDALKKHERRVNLQIDFITTKAEIKGLEDEQNQTQTDSTSEQNQQIKILLGKLKQKLDKMKIYMRMRNEEMKKLSQNKTKNSSDANLRRVSSTSSTSSQKGVRLGNSSSTSNKELNGKRPVNSTNALHPSKRLKSSSTHSKVPVVRLASRLTSHDPKNHSTRTPIVRFINKTSDSTINSVSPTTPASSSSTLSPPLIIANHSSTHGSTNNKASTMHHNNDDDDDDQEDLDLDLNVEELFADDDDEHPSKNIKSERNSHRQIQSNGSEKNSEKKIIV